MNLKRFVAFTFLVLLIYGVQVGAVAAIPVIWLGMFILLNWLRRKMQHLFLKNALSFVIFILGVLFSIHFLGFHNIKLGTVQFSANGVPQTAYFNFDKVLSGLILLYFYENKLIFSCSQFRKTFLIALVAIFISMGIALSLHFVAFDFKLHETILIWSLRNFFAVALCEEILFRGFLQESLITGFLPYLGTRWANVLGLIFASVLFGLFHYKSGIAMVFLASIAGRFYGWVYLKTNHVFYSALAHFTLNLTHFVFFTYPCLLQ